MELLNSKDVDELENFLYAVDEKTGFYGSMIISDDGLVILSSQNITNYFDMDSLAAMAANLFCSENIIDFDFLKDIEINFKEKKIFITRMLDKSEKKHRSIIFVTIIPPNIRYYKRKINKIRNKIKNFFI